MLFLRTDDHDLEEICLDYSAWKAVDYSGVQSGIFGSMGDMKKFHYFIKKRKNLL